MLLKRVREKGADKNKALIESIIDEARSTGCESLSLYKTDLAASTNAATSRRVDCKFCISWTRSSIARGAFHNCFALRNRCTPASAVVMIASMLAQSEIGSIAY